MWNIDELLNKLDIDFTRLHDLLVYDPHAPMIFSSGIFLLAVLPLFIVFYLLLQRRTTARLMFVTLFSYYFYYKSSGTYFFLLAIVTVSDFFIARLMERATVRWQRKTWVAVSLLINLGLLCYFKYTNFLCGFFASLTGGTFTAMDIFLPVGISFFTFQSLSYTIDVYRKETNAPHQSAGLCVLRIFLPAVGGRAYCARTRLYPANPPSAVRLRRDVRQGRLLDCKRTVQESGYLGLYQHQLCGAHLR